MTSDDARPFLSVLNAVAEICDRDLSDAAQTLYFDALKEFSLEDCVRALEHAVKYQRFMPMVSELRALIVGDTDAATERAWREYKRVAFAVGAYRSPTFADGALAATIIAVFGTWTAACSADLSPEMWVAKRREFERVYRGLVQDGVSGPTQLVGFCEQANIEGGYAPMRRSGQVMAGDGTELRRVPPGSKPIAIGEPDPTDSRAITDAARDQARANVQGAIENYQDVNTPAEPEVVPMEPLKAIAARALKSLRDVES
jgi:hypothetical protein